MKKIILSSLAILATMPIAFASIQSTPCASIGGNTASCGACYKETTELYTCNPYQTSCQKQAIAGLSDIVSNISGGDKVMYQADMGSYTKERIQSTTDWTMSNTTLGEMFEIPQVYLQPATAAWQKGYQYFTNSQKYGHYLPNGTSVLWTQMKSGSWIRPDVARPGTSRTSPAYKFTFTPRLYTNATSYIDHNQCIFFYVRFCGDGQENTDRGEQCDDGNMVSGDGCSNTCQNETAQAVCTGLTVTPTSVTNGGSITYSCTGTNTTSYSVVVKKPDGSTLQTFTSANGTVTVPSAPTGTYTAACYVNGQTDTPSVCQKNFTNNAGVTPLTCDNLSINPASLSQSGGTLTATCEGTSETQYKFVLKQDGSVTNTVNYQTSSQTTFSIPANSASSSKDYSVECHVKNATETDKTSTACMKTLTVPGTTPEPICTNLTVSPTSVTNGGSITYSCTGTNTTSYSVVVKKPDGSTLQTFTSANGTITVPSAPTGTYTAACYVNGQTDTPSVCQKNFVNNGTIVEQPTCSNLSVTKNGTSVDYSCTGSGDITSYTIQKGGSTVSNNASGSLYLGYGTHTLKCFVNSNITSNACEKTVTIEEPDTPEPRIQVIKDDNDNRDDRQNLEVGDDAEFSILVRNNGSEALENVTLNDPRATECNRSAAQTLSLIRKIGNRDSIFDPGESFTYVCQKNNVNERTFPNNENNICVYGRGEESGRNVEDCDPTRVSFQADDVCDFMRVDFDRIASPRSAVQVSCSPTDGYKLGIVKNGRVVDRFQSPVGEFDFELEPGKYSLTCLRDGETVVRSSCTKSINIMEEEKDGECRMRSTSRFGGAPLRTRFTCETPDNNDCRIGITRNGKVWKTINDCEAGVTLPVGDYEAICILDGRAESRCSTGVVVDAMTSTPTGPGAMIMMILASLSGAGFIFYKRRKTV